MEERKIMLFHSGLSIRQLWKKEKSTKVLGEQIVLSIFKWVMILCTGIMALVFLIGIDDIAAKLFMLGTLAMLWLVPFLCGNLMYIVLEHQFYVSFSENGVVCKRTSAWTGMLGKRNKIAYSEMAEYYIGACNVQILPRVNAKFLITPEQCMEVYGEYINVIDKNKGILFAVPYTEQTLAYILEKKPMNRITEEKAIAITPETAEESKVIDEYNGYIN